MAATTQLVAPARTARPVALWHLLSLDAPTVAALWTWFVARAAHVRLPLASPAAMALAVWVLYATDRLLDARLLDARPLGPCPEDPTGSTGSRTTGLRDRLEARHLFHHRHRRAFLAGIAIAAVGVAALLPRLAPAAVRLYLLQGALLVVWFLILHGTRSAHRLPKEIAVGLFFSAAIFIPTIARRPGLHLPLLPSAALFAALCSLNCLFICAWEHADGKLVASTGQLPYTRPTHATTHFALAHLSALATSVAIAGAALAIFDPMSFAHSDERLVPIACTLSAFALLALDRNRTRLSPINLRAAADLALLTPLLLLPFLR